MHSSDNVKTCFSVRILFFTVLDKGKIISVPRQEPYGRSGGEKSALCPGCFTSGERVPVPGMGSPLGPRADGGTKISFRHQKLNLYSSVMKLLTLTLYRLGCPQRMSERIRCRIFILFIFLHQYLSYKYRQMHSYITKSSLH